MVYSYIWLDINNFTFENRPPSASIVAYKSLGLHYSWTTIHPRTMGKKTKHKIPISENTPMGWLNGASQSNGLQSGVGGVIRISPNTLCR
jgi:hypothetical protein